MTRRLLASSLALLAAPAFAQTADLDAFALDALTPSSRTVELLVDGEPGQSFGSVTETVTLEGGVLTYVSVANLPQAGGVRTRTVTLPPLAQCIERWNTASSVQIA